MIQFQQEKDIMADENIFFKKIIDALQVSVCVFDAERNIIYCNRGFADLFMEGADSYEGKSLYDTDPVYVDRITALPRVLELKRTVIVEKQDKSGEDYAIITTPVTDSEGNIEYVIEAIYDDKRTSDETADYFSGADRTADSMVFISPRMHEIKMTIERISTFDSTILISGEKGSGKSTLAKFIHESSKRSKGEFVSIDCAAVPENQMEAVLFGYLPGAGPDIGGAGKAGLAEIANGGTLFIDEIGMMPLSVQGKILRMIQDGTYVPLGAAKERKVSARIISATSMSLENQIKDGRFREDLYYRLRVIEFNIPTLKERKEDFDVLLDYFAARFNYQYHMNKSFSDKARYALRKYEWPGNVSELQNAVERVIVTSKENVIETADLPDTIIAPLGSFDAQLPPDFEDAVETYERRILEEAYRQYGSSYKIAEAMGMSQTKASRLMRKYGIGRIK